jgi:hypothetical protein
MSTQLPDREVPDEVPAPDYLEQHTGADPDRDTYDDDENAGGDESSTGDGGRTETDRLGGDVEADEADLLEQATSVPTEDTQYDREE